MHILKKFNFLSIIFSFFCLGSFYSQENYSCDIPWGIPIKVNKNDKVLSIPFIKGNGYDVAKPIFSISTVFNYSNDYSVFLKSFSTELALKEEKEYVESYLNDYLNDSVKFEAKITYAKNQRYFNADVFPFVIEEGEIRRVKNLVFEFIQLPKSSFQKSNKSYNDNSVLRSGSGQWYKISVPNDGVYKIDKTFLESCGISTSNLNPNNVRVFGNGEGRLPELNSVFRTDDLAENAVKVVGGVDNRFDQEDYILFYGWGPNKWNLDNDRFYADKNIYSDNSFYFININSGQESLKIQTIVDGNSSFDNHVTSYSYRHVHENDLVSLVGGGQRWYGELFDVELSKQFNLTIPDIITSQPMKLDVAIASNASNSSNTGVSFSVSGLNLYSTTLPVGEYGRKSFSFSFEPPSSVFDLNIDVVRNSPTVLTYLDYITYNFRRELVFTSNQFNFRDLNSIGSGKFSKFTIKGTSSNYDVWDVTNKHFPKIVTGEFIQNNFEFIVSTDSLREFSVFNIETSYSPHFVSTVKNQNLHGLAQVDYLIVTHPNFIAHANRLANLHRDYNGLSVHVVTTDQVFNEFSSGTPDPTAIKDFVRMFYERANADNSLSPKYLLLFGDGTYDPKNRLPNNNNFVPTYQVLNSEYSLSAMVTDDYFGMLDQNESISSTDMLDIGVGRLLVSDQNMAKQQVDKIEHYLKNGSNLFSSGLSQCTNNSESEIFGDWRNKYVIIADDEEGGYFINQDGEPNSSYVETNFPEMNCDKIYLDAYKQVSSAGGQRYPDVLQTITDRVESGALVLNYIGHGGEKGAAEERVITIPQINDWVNIDKLNLFVSATCEFTKFDDPSRVSAGEWISLNTNGGAIALMTTTRSVFFGVNTVTGRKFYENVFSRDSLGAPLRFGDIIRLTKNASGSSDNKRSFTLIGDPALRIALPYYKVVTDSVNGLDPSVEIDTLRALSKVRVKGHVEDWNNNVLSGFEGVLQPTVLDKIKNQNTLGQDPDSPIISFETQKNSIYRGKATVKDGYFDYSFIVPKDIDYSFGNGKISYYANDQVSDAQGVDQRLIVGGIDTNGLNDMIGPEINLFLNEMNFVNGGLTNESPTLIVELFDESGINTVGNGIGHDITLVIDGQTSNPIILNEYYSANIDSYQEGGIIYNLDQLSEGSHELVFKVWDVNNNSSESRLEFVVQKAKDLSLKHVLNYPNPFTTSTDFYFEHNQVCSSIDVQIQIFTVSGKLIKTINQNVSTSGFRSEGVFWDGLDEYGDKLARGVYIYKLTVRNEEGKTADKVEKLVLLR